MQGYAVDWETVIYYGMRIAAVLICIIIHEVSHGLAAYKLGDQTAKDSKRLSLNPLRHIDPIGLLMMIFVGFGWAKPVPVDPRHFKNPKSGMAITAFAGPFSNFILAFVAALFYQGIWGAIIVTPSSDLLWYAAQFFYLVMMLSIGLGIFNLIPFPPLDGSKILGALLPERIYFSAMRFERYGMLILLAVIWFGFLDGPLIAARDWVFNLYYQGAFFMRTAVISIMG